MNQQPLTPIFISQRNKPQRNAGVRMGSGCLWLFALFFLIGSIGLLSDGNAAAGTGMFITSAVIAGLGVFWFRWMKKREDQRISQYHEKLILDIAAMNGGVVTLAMISQSTPLSVSEVEETLRRLAMQGLARTELLEDGGIVYRFIGLGPIRFDE